ncbi:MAG TPA: DUF4402 domain-containing protein [Longimicrobiales bacterium]|nr:DUF4402 domain-containing protein [Longimicrobiales bacterium]
MRHRTMLLAVALLVTASPLDAQQVNVAASVPVRSPTGAGVRNLTFGAITPLVGQTVDVDVVAAAAPQSGSIQAGEFRYDVAGVAGLDFSLTMPATLTSGSLPPLTLTSTGAQYGGWCVTSGGSGCVLTGFDPAGASVRVCQQTRPNLTCHPNRFFPPATELGVYVGGRLSVPSTARAGVYTGTVTLTIVQVY